MKEFRRNKKTGVLEVWESGKKVGTITTMGDQVKKENKDAKH